MQPLIILTIEINQGNHAQIQIYQDTNPQQEAQNFIQTHNLPQKYLEPLVQKIIQQMLLYDKITTNDKENRQQKKKPIWENQNKSKKRQKTPNQGDTDNEFEIYEKLYQQSKQLQEKKKIKVKEKQEEYIKQEENELTFTPKINKNSRNMIKKKQMAKTYDDFFTSQKPQYTQEQIENSFKQFLFQDEEWKDEVIFKLFKLLENHGVIDANQLPIERLSSQLLVTIRNVLKGKQMKYPEFYKTIDEKTIRLAADYFGLQKC